MEEQSQAKSHIAVATHPSHGPEHFSAPSTAELLEGVSRHRLECSHSSESLLHLLHGDDLAKVTISLRVAESDAEPSVLI